MTTTNKQLDAASVRDRILNAKGNFVKAAWKSNPKPKAEHKNVLLEKHTLAVVRSGIDYANLSAVKDAIAAGERSPEIGELPWGSWYYDKLSDKSWFPYVIEHSGELYLRLYPSEGNNHKATTIYYVGGEEVTKDVFASYLTNSEAKKLLEPNGEKPLCFTIKLKNLLDLPQDFDE